jgi:hypothetical protein
MAVDDNPVSVGGSSCPNCRDAMERHVFEGTLGEREPVDFCCPCRSMWFDRGESTRIAPRGILEIFGLILKRQGEWRRPLERSLACPRCRGALEFTHDLTRSGRFTYYRCGAGHGRFTPFTEFLREKQFVRELAPAELARVRAEVKQVRCSGCGAMVDITKDNACSYCGAPIAILDADAVEAALRQWAAQAAQPARLAVTLSERMPQLPQHCLPLGPCPGQPNPGVDLIDGGIAAVGSLLSGMGLKL